MVINKPWGQEELIFKNDKYMVKKLTMNNGHRCSLQYHDFKIETIYVLEGLLTIEIDKSFSHHSNYKLETLVLNPGQFLTIHNGQLHRMSAVNGCAVYLESSTPEIDDVKRIEDDYHR